MSVKMLPSKILSVPEHTAERSRGCMNGHLSHVQVKMILFRICFKYETKVIAWGLNGEAPCNLLTSTMCLKLVCSFSNLKLKLRQRGLNKLKRK